MIGKPGDKEADAEAAPNDRDRGMGRCFDEKLLRKFILFLGNVDLNR